MKVRPRSLGRTTHAPEASSSSKIRSPFLMRGQMSVGKFAIKLFEKFRKIEKSRRPGFSVSAELRASSVEEVEEIIEKDVCRCRGGESILAAPLVVSGSLIPWLWMKSYSNLSILSQLKMKRPASEKLVGS